VNWKKWKIGLVIAFFCSLLTAGAGLVDPEMGWRGFVAVFCTSCLTNLVNYLAKHPLENVSNTEFLKKD
jgi:hypothetical protein